MAAEVNQVFRSSVEELLVFWIMAVPRTFEGRFKRKERGEKPTAGEIYGTRETEKDLMAVLLANYVFTLVRANPVIGSDFTGSRVAGPTEC